MANRPGRVQRGCPNIVRCRGRTPTQARAAGREPNARSRHCVHARTPIGRAYKGAFNDTHGATLAGHALAQALSRARLEGAEVEDVILGCALQQGATGGNIARQAAIRAGLPVTAAGTTIDRQCSSGLQAISIASQRVMFDGVPIAIGGGLDSISLVQNEHMNRFHGFDDWLQAHKPEIYMPMIDTAEIVAQRYQVTRETQDVYALESQKRTAAAQQAGRFDAEIVPFETRMGVADRATGEISFKQVTLAKDEGNRPDTTAEGLAALKPVRGEGHVITAGNASQLSDGASACVVMEAAEAARRGLTPLGALRGLAVGGLRAGRDGHRPCLRRAQAAGAQ